MTDLNAAPLLDLTSLCVDYNHFRALEDVDLTCRAGEVIALLGPNGAGKSTILKTAFGLIPATGGTIKWCGETVMPTPQEMVRRGLSYVPQGRSVFPTLTVRENLETSVHFLNNRKEIAGRLDEMLELFPALKEKWKAEAGTLSGGQQQMVVLARGLMTRPKLLLLDEPSLGLSPKLVREVFARVGEINKKLGTAFIVVEHNIKSLMAIVDHALVLKQGKPAFAGTPDDPALQDVIRNIFKM